MTTRLLAIELGDAPEAWRAAGFDVVDQSFDVGGVHFTCTGSDEGPGGVRSWTLAGSGPASVDGLPTTWKRRPTPTPARAHRNGAVALDHLVVGSPNRDRTVAAVGASLGLTARAQTEHALYGRPMVQTFFALPPTIIEVISRPEEQGAGDAVFWGLAFVTADLDATAYGMEACESPHPAVQPGRRIATVHGQALGISIPLAFMTPRPT